MGLIACVVIGCRCGPLQRHQNRFVEEVVAVVRSMEGGLPSRSPDRPSPFGIAGMLCCHRSLAEACFLELPLKSQPRQATAKRQIRELVHKTWGGFI